MSVDKQLDYLAARLGETEARMIDPKEFGRLQAEVESLQAGQKAQQEQMSSMQADIKELLALANRSRGGFWAGMMVASMIGSVVSWFAKGWVLR